MLEPRLKILLQHQVIGQVIIQHQAMLVPVLRYMAESMGIAGAYALFRHIPAIYQDSSPCGFTQAGYGVHQLRLPVAVDSGNADNLPAPYLKAHVVYHQLGMAFHMGFHRNMLCLQHSPARRCRSLFNRQAHLAAHHHLRHFLLGDGSHIHGAYVFSPTQNRTPVRHRLDFIQLVGNEKNGLAFRHQTAHNLHELVDFLGRQDRCGLVKYHDFIVPVEHFKYLHPLLHPHRNILNQSVRVNVQAVTLAELHHFFSGIVHLQEAAADRLHPQYNVLEHGKIVYQLEMLVHHTDSKGIGVQRPFYLHFPAPDLYDSLLRLVKAEQNAHQRGFPGTVLA